MRPTRYGDRGAKRAAFTPAVVSAVTYPRNVPGDTVTLRGGPWDGELYLSAHDWYRAALPKTKRPLLKRPQANRGARI